MQSFFVPMPNKKFGLFQNFQKIFINNIVQYNNTLPDDKLQQMDTCSNWGKEEGTLYNTIQLCCHVNYPTSIARMN
jgi:hypothetical protein